MRPVLVLGLVLIMFAAACGAPKTQADGQADDTAVAQTLEPSAPVLAEFAVASGPAPAVPVPAPQQSADEGALDEARQRAALLQERTAVLVESFIDEGLAALDRNDLEGAHSAFTNAYELDPSNPVAADMYGRTAALLGDEQGSLVALAADARTMSEVRRQQRRIDVGFKVEQGRQALNDGDPEEALVNFDDALALLRWDPSAADEAVSEGELKAYIAQAQQAIEERDAAREEELARRAEQAAAEFDELERNRTALKVKGLLRAANDHFWADEYDLAIERLDQVLLLDPRNEDATALREIAVRADTQTESRQIARIYRREWNRTFDNLKRDTIIPLNVIEFPGPEAWAVTEGRGPRSFGDTERGKPADDAAVAARLDEVRMAYEYTGNTLDEVLQNLHEVSGVNFIMSPDVQDEAFNQSYDVRDRNPQPLSRILKVILEMHSIPEMTYTIRDGIVRVLTKDESRGDYLLQMYDIRDLTITPVDHAAEEFNLTPSGTDPESFTEGVEDEDPLPLVSEDTLLTLIQDNISPDSWSDDPERSITQMPGTLIVKTTPDVHEQIESLLSDLRKNTTTLINIQTRFIEVEDTFLEDIGVDLRGLDGADGLPLANFGQANAGGVGTPSDPSGIGTDIDSGAYYQGVNGDLKGRTENLFDSMLGEEGVLTGGGGLALEALFLDDVNVNAVLRAVSKYQTSNIVNAPSLTLRSGQRGNIKVLTNRTYVRDFEPEIATGAVIAQPELGVVKDGIVLDVRAVASADRRFITLELRPTLAELIPGADGDPLPDFLVSLATPNANNVTIQLPELKIQRLRTTATLPDGATLLLGGLKTSVEQDYRSSMPILGDIPILSFFFSRQGDYVSKRKLLILLTASIVAPEEHEPNTAYLR